MANYVVTLSLLVEGNDESDAVLAFVDHLTARGVRVWKYAVTQDGSDLGVFNGYGEKDAPQTVYDENDNSDEALLAAAVDLNKGP